LIPMIGCRGPFLAVLIATIGRFYSYYKLPRLSSTILNRVLNIDPPESGGGANLDGCCRRNGISLGGLLADVVGSRLALANWASASVIAIYPIVYDPPSRDLWAMLL